MGTPRWVIALTLVAATSVGLSGLLRTSPIGTAIGADPSDARSSPGATIEPWPAAEPDSPWLSDIGAGSAGSVGVGPSSTTETVHYTISLPAPQTQMVDVSMRIPRIHTESIEVALPTWRPGLYEILDFASTVREVRAESDDGRSLPIRKLDKSAWRIDTDGSDAVTLRYRVYANSLEDRTRHVDDTHAFLSPSSVLMYMPDRRQEPLRVTVEAPPDWRVGTGLDADPRDAHSFVAPSYDVLVDSPLEIGLQDRVEFEIDGVPHEIVIWPPGIEHDARQLVADFTAIVREQIAIFGRMPYERYVFLIHAAVPAHGGTEHLNSTIIQTSRESIEGSLDASAAYERFLELVSHEMFHTWNVKQLRPAGLQPYDYQAENYTRLLWVAEGTTSYFDDLTLTRAGLMTIEAYLEDLGSAITALRQRPGARVQSLEDSSFDAWIKSDRASPDDVNSEVSFYTKGALVSLLLDLEIRRVTGGAMSLDDLMREMFERFPLDGPGYTPDDLVATVEALTGSDFDAFFERYVRGTAVLPFEDALGVIGLELAPAARSRDDADEPDHKAYIGLDLTRSGGRTMVRAVLADGPAYLAGVMADDEIIAMDGRRLRVADLDARLERLAEGDVVTFTIMRRDVLRTITVTLDGRPDGRWRVRRVKEPTDAQRAGYESWLGQPWPADE